MTPREPPDRRDPLGLRAHAPLFDAYLRARDEQRNPFTIPGHKGRADLVGPIVADDLPLHGGVDTIRLDGGLLLDAERRAAALWGATWCRFSVGGATHGNQALALAVGRPGDRVLVSRTLHRSMMSGLVLAGLEPVWIQPQVDAATGLPRGVDPELVHRTLDAHPDLRAVFVGDPSYVGGIGDVAGMARAAHDHDVPLVVDAAWGAHLGFHPRLPEHALAQGADALVTSAHKTLPAWSQAAIVLACTERSHRGALDPDRLDRAFDTSATTSPSGTILASTDAARAVLEHHGDRLLGRVIDLVAGARDRLSRLDGVRTLDGPWVDPTKLVVCFDHVDGFAVERHLRSMRMPVESADRSTVVAMVTMADTDETVTALVDGIADAVRSAPRSDPGTDDDAAPDRTRQRAATVWDVRPETVIDPRTAAFADHVRVPADDAIGRVSAETIAPYPPGVPVLAPGERITAESLAILIGARDDGARIAYAADPTLTTIQVIDDAPPRPGGPR